jgi:hypothetical protein
MGRTSSLRWALQPGHDASRSREAASSQGQVVLAVVVGQAASNAGLPEASADHGVVDAHRRRGPVRFAGIEVDAADPRFRAADRA